MRHRLGVVAGASRAFETWASRAAMARVTRTDRFVGSSASGRSRPPQPVADLGTAQIPRWMRKLCRSGNWRSACPVPEKSG